MSHCYICHQIVSQIVTQGITNHESHPKKVFVENIEVVKLLTKFNVNPFIRKCFLIILSFLVWGGKGNLANSDGDGN